MKKKSIRFENTPSRIPTSRITEFFLCYIDKALRSQWNKQMNIFLPCDLDLLPIILTYELDLDILPLDLHAKIQGRMSTSVLP